MKPPSRTSDWEQRAVTASEVVRHITSGMRVFVHGAAATPTPLLEALCERARTELEDVELCHLHTAGPAPWVEPDMAGRLRSVSFFAGAPVRAALASGCA